MLTEGPKYNAQPCLSTRVKWYRCRVTREQLASLNRRSNFLGFVPDPGLSRRPRRGSAGAAIYSSLYWPWYITLLLVFINGHFWHFLVNGFHELVHDSVFRTRWLNRFFLRVYSFLGWHNHHHFWASHTEHHKYTLHHPDDQEVILPQKFDMRNMWKWSIINYRFPYDLVRGKLAAVAGQDPGRSVVAGTLSGKRSGAAQGLYQLGTVHVHRPCADHRGTALVYGLVGRAPGHSPFPRCSARGCSSCATRRSTWACRTKSPTFRLCCRTFYINPCPSVPLLAHELPHRAPHVRRGTLLQTWAGCTGS